uniref:Carbamate kinase n=1 Tax=Thermofilum pendens TaxID=2269 RepID=A0A7C1P4L2_THEPE
MRKPVLVLALGGNALLRKGEKGAFEEQLSNLLRVAPSLLELSKEYQLVVTHGNGPQVGNLYLQQESTSEAPPMPLHACVAMTQSLIGYLIQLAVNSFDPRARVAVVPTRSLVDPEDPAFREPTKPIGPYYPEPLCDALLARGWSLVRIPGRGCRRVVPSPKPKRILDIDVIRELLGRVEIVVAAGGGGIPVVERGGRLEGVDAVIDKDLASSLLARELGADLLVILTDVEGVYLNYGKPDARLLTRLCASEAERLLSEGYFPAGSMGPKVEACVEFVKRGGRAAIGSLEKVLEVVRGVSGTLVENC